MNKTVCGQNVAYALTVCRPLIQRRSLTGRWVTTLSILVLFATITRFEPSVLRATVMAGLAVTARTVGREASAGRLLALAVIVLLVVDPLLAITVAFRLSVAASAGILWISPAVASRVGGPEWLRESLGVTVGAQLAVAPVLVSTFGPISLVSVPANVAAGPIAGLVMAWGMTAGIVAGFGLGWLAGLIHAVSIAGLVALESIARAAATLPLAPVGMGWLVVAVAVVGTRPWWRTSAGTLLAAVVALCVLVVAVVPSTSPGSYEVGYDSTLEVTVDAVILRLGDERNPAVVLESLYRLGIRRIDVIETNGTSTSAVVSQLRQRVDVDHVVDAGTGVRLEE